MKTSKSIILFALGLSLLFFFQCKEELLDYDDYPPEVDIEDVWMESMVDVDGDGYFSAGALYYDLVSNKLLGVKCYVLLCFKRSVYLDSTIYTCVYESEKVDVYSTNANIWYVPLGECSGKLERDFYHLMLVVRRASDDSNLDKESSDEDLHYIPLEPLNQDTLPTN